MCKTNKCDDGKAKILEILFIFAISFKMRFFIVIKDKIVFILRKIIQDKMYCNIILL